MKTKMVYNDKKTPISIRAALFALLEEYTCKKSSAPKKAQSTILPLLFGYLEEHFREELTLSDVAMALGYSESYISHSLSKICGMNFSSLVSGIRIEEAKRLLVTTSLPISSVALESGFGTERSFHRAFSKLVGMTPSRYKEGKETK